MRTGFAAAVLAGLSVAAGARAQQGVLAPAQSAAKAKQLVAESIQALGGQAYLGAHDQTCNSQLARFGFHAQLDFYGQAIDYNLYPDKERTELYKQRNVIDVNNGNQGWSLDRGGVSDMSADQIADFQKGLKESVDYLFRYQRNDPNLEYSYAGTDVVDLKQVDWVEIDEGNSLTARIALDQYTHLPVRAEFISRDPETHVNTTDADYFSNYHRVDGIETPFQETMTHNGQKTLQVFIASCSYNTGLEPSFFTREALEERWKQLGGKKKQKKKKKSAD